MNLNLLNGEEIISESDNKELVLTTLRIRQYISYAGKHTYKSIMLEDIVSIQMAHKKNYWLILFAIIAILVALFSFIGLGEAATGVLAASFIIAIILVIFFFLSMKGIVSIDSAKGSIEFNTKGMNPEKIISFLELIEKAKKGRVEFLKSK